MVSIKGQMSCSRILILFTVLLMILAGGCTIGRVYIGSEIKHDPKEKIQNGVTTKSQILEIFGPPDLVQRQFDGDVFLYAYLRKNSTKFYIEEPYITNLTIFSYSRIQQKKDSLVVLFDKEGVVKNYGYQRGTSELTTF
jgi:outer membrane protein assembly factor BamE (lipoprotein component of BamABCDE complex)